MTMNVAGRPAITLPPRASNPNQLFRWANDLSRNLITVLTEISTRLNTTFNFSGFVEVAQITANQNNYAPSTANGWLLSSDATRTITGLDDGGPTRLIFIVNTGNFPIVLAHESSSSVAQNRIVTASKTDTILPADGGIVAVLYDEVNLRWRVVAHEAASDIVTVRQFGAVGDGTTDDLAAFQAARDFAATRGRVIYIPPGVYALSATLVDNEHGLTWVGASVPGRGQTGGSYDTAIRASGTSRIVPASGFTSGNFLWRFTADTSGTIHRVGGGMRRVILDGQTTAAGLECLSLEGAVIEDVVALYPNGDGVSVGITVTSPGGARIGTTSRCVFRNVDCLGGHFALWGNVSVTSNTALCHFENCNVTGGQWHLENCDSNWFLGCGGTCTLHAGDTGTRSSGTTRSARANVLVAWQGGITAKTNVSGGNPPSYRNIILGFTKENSASLTIEDGAKLISLTDQVTTGSDTAGVLSGRWPAGAFARRITSNQSITSSTWTAISWNSELYDTLGCIAVTTTDFVVPNGIFTIRMQAQVTFANSASGTMRQIRIRKNGANLLGGGARQFDHTITDRVWMDTPILQVVPGDVFTVEVWQDTGGALNALFGTDTWACMECL